MCVNTPRIINQEAFSFPIHNIVGKTLAFKVNRTPRRTQCFEASKPRGRKLLYPEIKQDEFGYRDHKERLFYKIRDNWVCLDYRHCTKSSKNCVISTYIHIKTCTNNVILVVHIHLSLRLYTHLNLHSTVQPLHKVL